jgi:hypothetical protein
MEIKTLRTYYSEEKRIIYSMLCLYSDEESKGLALFLWKEQ